MNPFPHIAIIVVACVLLALSWGCIPSTVDAGHEGVFILQPYVFGHGGVEPTPMTAGMTWTALSTQVVRVDMRPIAFDEKFDIISSDNAPVSFTVHLVLQAQPGQSPTIVSKFGNYYDTLVKEPFRTAVREEVQRHPLFELTTKPDLREAIVRVVREVVIGQIKANGVPVTVLQIVVGAIVPPQEVIDQTKKTIVEQQRALTMIDFAKAEKAREAAERQRGISDRAYRDSLGMNPDQFLALRRIEVQHDIVKEAPQALTVIMGMDQSPFTIPVR